MNIKEIKEILKSSNISEEILEKLKLDERIGVKKLLASYYKNLEKIAKLKEEYQKRTKYEKKYYNMGYKYICGIDEVGRGPIAGPLIVAAVILKSDSYFLGLTDSKKLSKSKREYLYDKIKKEALAYEIIELDNFEIEKYNIYKATQIAMKEAVKRLKIKPDFVLIDAMPLDSLEIPNISIIKGDEKSISIAAASVLAKVYRDNIMQKYDKIYPHYDFKNNMGYGTQKHLEGLKKYSYCKIHRRDFEPIKSMIKKEDNNE